MIQVPLDPFFVFLMILLRSAFVLGFFPLIGEQFVPMRVRLMLAFVISMALMPVAPVSAALWPTTIGGMVLHVLSEATLGFAIGFVGRILFAIIQFAGQIAGEQMGFGLVNAIDPSSHQNSIIAEMQYMMAILIFMLAGIHHVFILALARSFEAIAPGTAGLSGGVTDIMMTLGAQVFSLSLQFAMPVIIVVFAINIALGMVARAVPQINVFMESFPLRIIGGMAVMLLSFGYIVEMWEHMFGSLDNTLANLLKAFA